MLAWLTCFPLLVALMLWCFERVDLAKGLAVLFAGAACFGLLQSDTFAWKGSIGIFLTVAALALVARARLTVTRLVLVAAAVLNAVYDSRTMAVICVGVLCLTMLPWRQRRWFGRRPKWASVVLVAGMAAFSNVAVWLMVEGYLGKAIQGRTLNQIDRADNIILGGRTEWAASLDLAWNSPLGYGVAVTPDSSVVREAMHAVRQVGGDYNNEFYWYSQVFGSRLDLHSIFADLWMHFSLGGLVMALFIGWTLFKAIPLSVGAIRYFGAGPSFLILTGLWDLFFSPMGSADRLWFALAAAIALLTIHGRTPRNLLPE